MAHVGTLRDYRFSAEDSAHDIRGSHLYDQNEEKLGKIDDVIFDHNSGTVRYIVVDTGGWLSSKKFIVPAQQLRRSVKHGNDYEVSLSKQQVESFPPYDESSVNHGEDWRKYEKRYHKAWTDGEVQHRTDSDHNITPTATEMPPQAGSIGSRLSKQELQSTAHDRIVPAGHDEVVMNSNAVGLGSRWSNFEDRLRQRRKEITNQCVTCSNPKSTATASDRERDERKAS